MTDVITSDAPEWERKLSAILPLFGHRNWIVVADSAYPAQSKPGIETIRANVYVDQELDFVAEYDAQGILNYRMHLEDLLASASAKRLPHEQIIQKLDQSAEVFRILIIKTDMTIPYTTVFFELDCGYWSAEAEQQLRKAMRATYSS